MTSATAASRPAKIGRVQPKNRPALSHEGGPERPIRAKYDAAQSTDDNKLYWGGADGLSARAANSPGVRRILRNRARYEVANNCYADGMLSTLADYVVGTGPKLQVLTDDEQFNEAVEQAFFRWDAKTRWGQKLWQMRYAWGMDGESFGLFFSNLALDFPVKLDLRTYEPEQIADNGEFALNVKRTDGLILDDFGNVAGYKLLPEHPGDLLLKTANTDPDTVAAESMVHLMRRKRAQTYRAVPEITAALMLYPIMRRLTLATLHAAETAAKISGVLRTQSSTEDPDEYAALDALELGMNEWMTLPMGWDISQYKAEHPNAEYQNFKREVIAEIARCLKMPYNIAASDSSSYNFASGKLDHTGFFKAIGIDQSIMRDEVADPTFDRWYAEAIRLDNFLPTPPDNDRSTPPHEWVWDGEDLLDPREANSQAVAASHGLDSIPRLHAKRGLRTDQVQRSNAKALGMTVEEYQESLRAKYFGQTGLAPAGDESEDD